MKSRNRSSPRTGRDPAAPRLAPRQILISLAVAGSTTNIPLSNKVFAIDVVYVVDPDRSGVVFTRGCFTGNQKFTSAQLKGSFILSYNQKLKSLSANLKNILFTDTDESRFYITGEGFYWEKFGAEDFITSTFELNANFNFGGVEYTGIFLTNEFNGNSGRFPTINALTLREFTFREDCFDMALFARPIEEEIRKFFIRGDVNADGLRDISDPITILTSIFIGDSSSSCNDSADANDNGKVDIIDSIFLLQYFFLGAESPPIPSFYCGLDITEDTLDCNGQSWCMGVR